MRPEELARRLTPQLYDRLPASWHVPPLVARGPTVVLAAAPEWVVDYRVVVGGKWPTPEGVVVHGRATQPHPLAVALWRAASDAPGFLLVVRTPTLAPGTRATGERPDEVRRFDPASPELAVEWIVREAQRIHAEIRPGVPYISGKEARERVKAEEAARFARAAQEAEEKRKAEAEAKAQIERQRTAWTVKRGHRVPKP